MTRNEPQPYAEMIVPDISDPTLVGSWCHPRVAFGADYSPAGNDMTPFGAAKMGRSGSFIGDGSSAYLRKAIADFRSGDSQGTIEAWINRAAAGSLHAIFSSSDEATDNYRFRFAVSALNKLVITQKSNDALDEISGDTTIGAAQWHHVVLASSGTAYALYVNGVAQALSVDAGANTGDWFFDTALRDNIVIGAERRTSTGSYFNGSIASVNVYSEPKSADWVVNRYQRAVEDKCVLAVVDGLRDNSRFETNLSRVANPIVGKKITLDGTSDYLYKSVANWRSNDSQGMILAWVRPASVAAVSKGALSSADEATGSRYIGMLLRPTTNKIQISTNTGAAVADVYGNTANAANQWVLAAVVSTGTVFKIYRNGIAESLIVGSGSNNGDWFADISNRDNIVIGAFVTSAGTLSRFPGDLWNVRVYSAVPTDIDAWMLNYYDQTRRQVPA